MYRLPNGSVVSPSQYYWDMMYEWIEDEDGAWAEFLPDAMLAYRDYPLGSREWVSHIYLGEQATDYIPDFNERAEIIADFCDKVANKDGGVSGLWQSCGGDVRQFFTALDETIGYHDPEHHKKANLLIKVMEQAGLWLVPDDQRQYLSPPLDYHLINLAVKTGMVDVQDEDIRQRLTDRSVLTEGQAAQLRLACRDAYAIVSSAVGDPWAVDSALWSLSRSLCYDSEPSCDECPMSAFCVSHNSDNVLLGSFPAILTNAF
jgi:hypothetical protein